MLLVGVIGFSVLAVGCGHGRSPTATHTGSVTTRTGVTPSARSAVIQTLRRKLGYAYLDSLDVPGVYNVGGGTCAIDFRPHPKESRPDHAELISPDGRLRLLVITYYSMEVHGHSPLAACLHAVRTALRW